MEFMSVNTTLLEYKHEIKYYHSSSKSVGVMRLTKNYKNINLIFTMYFQLQFLKNLPNLFFTVSIKFLFVLNVQQNPTIQSELSIMLFLLTIVYSVVGI